LGYCWDISPKLEQEKVEEAAPDHCSGVCPDEPEPAPTASLNLGGLFPQFPWCHRGSTDSISGLFWEPGRGLVAENITPWVDGGAVVI